MKRFLAISLSVILLFSSLGFTVTTHFCGGHAVKSQLALGNTNIDCGMTQKIKMCATHSTEKSIKRKRCCENEFMSLSIDDDYQPTMAQPTVDTDFIFTFVYTFFQIRYLENEQSIAFSDYYPPPLTQDTQVLFQSFLI